MAGVSLSDKTTRDRGLDTQSVGAGQQGGLYPILEMDWIVFELTAASIYDCQNDSLQL